MQFCGFTLFCGLQFSVNFNSLFQFLSNFIAVLHFLVSLRCAFLYFYENTPENSFFMFWIAVCSKIIPVLRF